MSLTGGHSPWERWRPAGPFFAVCFENLLDMEKVWRSRGYVPHWEAGERPQAITFRLADSLPAALLKRWEDELVTLPEEEAASKRRVRIERALDSSHGQASLREPGVGEIVENALLYFDGDRYRLHAWVIMPNHVHVLITPIGGYKLSEITHSWKSFTAKKANALLNRAGAFWSREYFDRAIRDGAHYHNAVTYFAMNPVSAGLCGEPEQWRFSSAWSGRKSRRDASAPRES
jgi:REP element-mobilizing transposase RayT